MIHPDLQSPSVRLSQFTEPIVNGIKPGMEFLDEVLRDVWEGPTEDRSHGLRAAVVVRTLERLRGIRLEPAHLPGPRPRHLNDRPDSGFCGQGAMPKSLDFIWCEDLIKGCQPSGTLIAKWILRAEAHHQG
jgi:hypothetical protein